MGDFLGTSHTTCVSLSLLDAHLVSKTKRSTYPRGHSLQPCFLFRLALALTAHLYFAVLLVFLLLAHLSLACFHRS